MKAGTVWVKEVPGFRILGKRDEEGAYLAECSCGHSLWGFADYWSLRAWISSHAARHMLKAVSK